MFSQNTNGLVRKSTEGMFYLFCTLGAWLDGFQNVEELVLVANGLCDECVGCEK